MTAASKPMPAMTRKMSSSGRWSSPERSMLTRPTSTRRSCPVSATTRAFSIESMGSPRLRASRLPVPPGSRPRGVVVPTSPWATARTVPSPPSEHTSCAPCSTAARAWPRPGSATVVSAQIGEPQPCARHTSSICTRNESRSVNFVGFTTMPARGAEGCGSGSISATDWPGRPRRRSRPVNGSKCSGLRPAHHESDRADREQHERPADPPQDVLRHDSNGSGGPRSGLGPMVRCSASRQPGIQFAGDRGADATRAGRQGLDLGADAALSPTVGSIPRASNRSACRC